MKPILDSGVAVTASDQNDKATEEAIDELYALPLGAFIAARNALATGRRKAGDRDGAQLVNKLTKPALAAWVTNQTVRRAPALVQQLLQATDALAVAHRQAGRGREATERFQAATGEQREALAALAAIAAKVLAESEHGKGGGTLDIVENNLRWGAISPDARPLVESGRLLRDVEPPGFGALVGSGGGMEPQAAASSAAAPEKPAGPVTKSSPDARARGDQGGQHRQSGVAKAEARAQARAAAEREHAEKRRLATLRVQSRQARVDADHAGRALKQAEKSAHAARERVEFLEKDLAAARAALAAADAKVKESNDELETRESAAAELEASL